MPRPFVDIHCHLLPGIDDGASDASESLAMAMQAVEEGIETTIVTPHQLGGNSHNRGDDIRRRTAELQELLTAHQIPLRVLPGADVRIDDDMIPRLASGDVLTVGDHRKHVLLELPHELYFPLEPVLQQLNQLGMTGILTHPERNRGILSQPSLIEPLVQQGCLMQVTAGSLIGTFGPSCQAMAEQMCRRGWVHFLATDAHGARSRRPRLHDAYNRAAELAGERAAHLWCSEFPAAVASGRQVPAGPVPVSKPQRKGWAFWKKAS